MEPCRLIRIFIFFVLIHLAASYTPANQTRRNSVPVFYARGTNYEVGYAVGRAFKSMIQEYVDSVSLLNEVLLPQYKTDKGKEPCKDRCTDGWNVDCSQSVNRYNGLCRSKNDRRSRLKKVYELNLNVIQDAYPQYLEELRGTADGSDTPFYKLLLLHMDSMLWNNVEEFNSPSQPAGCSSILCNQEGQLLIGHNEDSFKAALNHIYILHADIEVEEECGRKTVESFASVCYAGELPGFTMGYNKHGIIFTVNVVEPKVNPLGMMPRHFVTRALLGARNLQEMRKIVQDAGGPGIGDGISLNVGYWKPDGSAAKYLYNIEAGPGFSGANASSVDVLPIKMGETLLHTNRFQRLEIEDLHSNVWKSSEHRDKRYKQLPVPKDAKSMLNVLGDKGDPEFPFHRGAFDDEVVTTVTGAFDLWKGTWSLYVENPKNGAPPVCVLSLDL